MAFYTAGVHLSVYCLQSQPIEAFTFTSFLSLQRVRCDCQFRRHPNTRFPSIVGCHACAADHSTHHSRHEALGPCIGATYQQPTSNQGVCSTSRKQHCCWQTTHTTHGIAAQQQQLSRRSTTDHALPHLPITKPPPHARPRYHLPFAAASRDLPLLSTSNSLDDLTDTASAKPPCRPSALQPGPNMTDLFCKQQPSVVAAAPSMPPTPKPIAPLPLDTSATPPPPSPSPTSTTPSASPSSSQHTQEHQAVSVVTCKPPNRQAPATDMPVAHMAPLPIDNVQLLLEQSCSRATQDGVEALSWWEVLDNIDTHDNSWL
jgi:hypothetical protein